MQRNLARFLTDPSPINRPPQQGDERCLQPYHVFEQDADEFDQDYSRIECANIEHLRVYRVELSREFRAESVRSLFLTHHRAVWAIIHFEGHSIYQESSQRWLMSPGDGIVWSRMFPRIKTISMRSSCLAMQIPEDLVSRRGFPADRAAAERMSAQEEICKLGTEIGLLLFDQIPTMPPSDRRKLAQRLRNLIYRRIPTNSARSGDRSQLSSIIARTKAIIQDNLRDPELCIGQIATDLECTKRYLHMAFAAEAMTISDYIWSARLEKCSLELLQPQQEVRSITDIAFSWGFNSSSHFNHVFKRRFGFAPSVLQRVARDGHTIRTDSSIPISAVPIRRDIGSGDKMQWANQNSLIGS